jgi:tellurite resistance protein TehA-like permease
MSASAQVMFGILFAFGYLVSPIVLIWGWSRWLRQPKVRTTPSILSLIGFVLATASALIAVSLLGYAQVHHFSYYDPLLLRVFRCGTLLSLGGIVFGISGVWRPSPLRWHAPALAAGVLTFWILAVAGE